MPRCRRGVTRLAGVVSGAMIAVALLNGIAQAEDLQSLSQDPKNWPMAPRDYASTRFSPLDQINAGNAGQLKLAWSFSLGVDRGQEAAPIVVDGTMYVVSPFPNKVFALDAATGQLKWTYIPGTDPASQGVACCDVVNRGAAYDNGKIFFNTLDMHTIALDAATGKELWVAKLGDINKGETMTMAPLVVKGKVLVGNSRRRDGRPRLGHGARREQRHDCVAGLRNGVRQGCADRARVQAVLCAIQGQGPRHQSAGRRTPGRSAAARCGGGSPTIPTSTRSSTGPAIQARGTRPNVRATISGPPRCSPATRIRARQFGPIRKRRTICGTTTTSTRASCSTCPSTASPARSLLHPGRNGFMYVIDRTTGEVLSADAYDYREHCDRGSISRPATRSSTTRSRPNSNKTIKNVCPARPAPRTGCRPPTRHAPSSSTCPISTSAWTSRWARSATSPARPTWARRSTCMPGRATIAASSWPGIPSRERSVWAIHENFPVWTGTLVTAGDVTFYGTMDRWFKALDARDGKILWQFEGPSGFIGQPTTFEGKDGVQYVAILSGVGGWPGAIANAGLDPAHAQRGAGLHGGDAGPADVHAGRQLAPGFCSRREGFGCTRQPRSRARQRSSGAMTKAKLMQVSSLASLQGRFSPVRPIAVAAVGVVAALASASRASPKPRSNRPPSRSTRTDSEATRGTVLQVPVSHLVPGGHALAPEIPNPLANDPRAVERGMKDFIQFNCVGCHAPNGAGGMGPSLSDNAWIYGNKPAQIYMTLVQGRPNGMPAFGQVLPDQTLWELVAYVQSISKDPVKTFGNTFSLQPQSPAIEQVPADKSRRRSPGTTRKPFTTGSSRDAALPARISHVLQAHRFFARRRHHSAAHRSAARRQTRLESAPSHSTT